MGCFNCFSSNSAKDKHELKGISSPNTVQHTNNPNSYVTEQPPPVPQGRPDTETVIALYAYDARTSSDISFQKDDKLIVLDKSNVDWWKARNLRTNLEGYIPSNYVASADSLQAKDWYFGMIKRVDSEAFLKQGLPGTFLVRESETRPGTWSLSVRAENDPNGNPSMKHFCIRTKSTTGEVFISNKVEFAHVSDLVAYYSQNKGLSIKLLYVCQKNQEQPETFGLAYDTWEVERASIKMEKQLGQGCFGEVWAGTWNGTTKVAIKTMKEGTMDAEKFMEEANVMKKLKHPHVLQLKAICSENEPVWIITELMVNGSLLDYLHKCGAQLTAKGNVTLLIQMAAQCADGMAYLEKENFIHRDLAARNVLVGENNLCKIADFGLSREDIYLADVKSKFPIKWTAPEAAFYQRYTIKSDVWSFGILMYEVITLGKVPYPGMRGQEVLEKIEMGYRMPQPHGCPDQYYNIMKDCWRQEAKERPSFETLKWQLEDYEVAGEGQYDET